MIVDYPKVWEIDGNGQVFLGFQLCSILSYRLCFSYLFNSLDDAYQLAKKP